MFYVKTKINKETCIDCGCELQIDLDEAVIDGHLDLFGCGMRCEDCSYKHALQHRGEAWAEMLIADYLANKKMKP